jgi:hypothetical protein
MAQASVPSAGIQQKALLSTRLSAVRVGNITLRLIAPALQLISEGRFKNKSTPLNTIMRFG